MGIVGYIVLALVMIFVDGVLSAWVISGQVEDRPTYSIMTPFARAVWVLCVVKIAALL